MKILHVITGIDRGGAENHLLDVVKHQCSRGWEVTVAYLQGDGYWAATMRELGAAVHHLGLRFYGDLLPLGKLRRLIRQGRFALVHAHLPPAELYTRLALLGIRPRALPMLISKHNDCPFHRLPGERAMGKWVAQRAWKIVAISKAVHEYMVGPAALPPGKVETIYYGIDASPFAEVAPEDVAVLRSEWGAGANTLVVGFAGRLVEQKSIHTLIEAFARFHRETACDAKLVIAGEGPLEAELRRVAEGLGLSDRVVWAGFREDVPAVMRAFDVFAITSVHEGFGLVLAEAMAAGKPVVATRAGAMPEIVVEGETGFLAAPGQPAEVAAALARLRDGQLRSRLGAAGRDRVAALFTREQMWAATDRLYTRCLGAAAGAPAAVVAATIASAA